jgi:hypothetical protein
VGADGGCSPCAKDVCTPQPKLKVVATKRVQKNVRAFSLGVLTLDASSVVILLLQVMREWAFMYINYSNRLDFIAKKDV